MKKRLPTLKRRTYCYVYRKIAVKCTQPVAKYSHALALVLQNTVWSQFELSDAVYVPQAKFQNEPYKLFSYHSDGAILIFSDRDWDSKFGNHSPTFNMSAVIAFKNFIMHAVVGSDLLHSLQLGFSSTGPWGFFPFKKNDDLCMHMFLCM